MSGRGRPRWATAADNDALIALARDCPMEGALRLYFDRAPDYFAPSAFQGEGARVCAIDDTVGDAEPARLAAAAATAPFDAVFVDGEVRRAMYACDLRVRPSRRGGLLVKRIYDFLTADGLDQGWELGFTTVMGGNAAMAGVVAGKAGLVPYRHVATMRNVMVQFALPRRRPRGSEVRPATAADLPAMVALWNRLQAPRTFAPQRTAEGWQAWLARCPGLALEDYKLAWRGDRLVGLVAIWDQTAFKRMVVLGYDPQTARFSRWYNPLARCVGLTPLPAPGGVLPYFYATQACAERTEDLAALYADTYAERRGQGHVFFSTMHDARDPHLAALDGYVTRSASIELFALDPHGHWDGERLARRLAYFDPALV